jgi:septal ring factor EnvC (AmiA/AmiB activator)
MTTLVLCCSLFGGAAQGALPGKTSHATTARKKPAAQASGKTRKSVGGGKETAAVAPSDPRDAAAERDRLTARIAELKQQIAAGERSRSGSAVALARAERALVEVNRHIEQLAARQRDAQDRVTDLDRRRAGTEAQIAARRTAYAQSATLLYVSQQDDALRTWVTGGDPAEALRTATYLGYLTRSQTTDLTTLRARADDLQAERRRVDDERRALADQAEAQQSARDALAADRASRRLALAQLSKQIAAQRDTAAALEADEKRLGRIVEQLQKAIERQAAEDRARREAARRAADLAAARKKEAAKKDGAKGGGDSGKQARESSKTAEEPPVSTADLPDDSVGRGAFAQLRGQLRLPVRGTIVGRFGAPRGSGGGTWKGVFVRTESGAEVHAVAAGKVVFADDLRGFGNILIVDHGDQYLSIYGNNETLLKKAGDVVKPGDLIARAGNSSGDEQTGLYFELRFRGRPFDPLSWSSGR